MKTWAQLSPDEREEWRRSPVTLAAMEHLAALARLSEAAVLAVAQNDTIDAIRFQSGMLAGMRAAHFNLTREDT